MTIAPEFRPVSTSEVADLKCETLWKYKYHPNYSLSPLTDGPAVSLGITGHSALEYFYNLISEGINWEDAREVTVSKLTDASIQAIINGDAEKASMFSDLAIIITKYINYYFPAQLDEWDIVGTEYKVQCKIPLPSGRTFNFVGRVDLIIRYKRGPFKGQIAPVDHKFIYNFWTLKAFQMSAQAPNYVTALKHMFPEETITHLLINQIRYRMDAKESYNQTPVDTSYKKRLGVMENHSILSDRANYLSKLSRQEVDNQTSRVMVKTICEYCSFTQLCDAQLEGTDTKTMEAVNFKPNTYGYKDND